MIIASIIESATSGSGAPGNSLNGATSVVFYTMNEATTWALIQSRQMVFGSGNYDVQCLISVVNTETQEHRWWYAGVEYTG